MEADRTGAIPATGTSFYPLQHFRVLELASGLAASFGARLLADAGATVVRVAIDEHRSPHTRGDPAGVADESTLRAYVDRGKESVQWPADRELDISAAPYDAIICDDLGIAADIRSLRKAGVVTVCVSPFGARGPKSHYLADDLILCAASGLLFSSPGYPDHVVDQSEPPLRASVDMAELAAGVLVASATLAALRRCMTSGLGCDIDFSVQEALAALCVWDQAIFSYTGTSPGRFGAAAIRVPNSYVPITDGWAVVVAYLDRHWSRFVAEAAEPELSDIRFDSQDGRARHAEAIEGIVKRWASRQTRESILSLAMRARLPLAPALSVREVVQSDHLAARNYLVEEPDLGLLPGDVLVADGVRRSVASPIPSRAQAATVGRMPPPIPEVEAAQPDSGLPLKGIRVIDFSQMVAMPLVGQWLGMLGADVILVESRSHLTLRGAPPFGGTPSVNTGGIFNYVNRWKKSCTINLRHPEGRALARRLVATADMAIENFSPGTLSRLGLAYESLSPTNPGLVLVSLSAFGSTGPWRDLPALHSGVFLMSGFSAVTGYADGPPRLGSSLLPDTVAGAYCLLGALQGLIDRDRHGKGRHVEIAMSEVMQAFMPIQISRASQGFGEPQRLGNRHQWKSPHGVFPCKGRDEWIAISVRSDEEFESLCRVIGDPGLATRAGLTTAPLRKANEDALERMIADWSVHTDARRTEARLQAAGVPASMVTGPSTLFDDAHLRARGFSILDHHLETGTRHAVALPWRIEGVERAMSSATPLLGADNEEVFGDLLGLTSVQIRALETSGAIE